MPLPDRRYCCIGGVRLPGLRQAFRAVVPTRHQSDPSITPKVLCPVPRQLVATEQTGVFLRRCLHHVACERVLLDLKTSPPGSFFHYSTSQPPQRLANRSSVRQCGPDAQLQADHAPNPDPVDALPAKSCLAVRLDTCTVWRRGGHHPPATPEALASQSSVLFFCDVTQTLFVRKRALIIPRAMFSGHTVMPLAIHVAQV